MGYILHYEQPALFGFFTELNPNENPIVSMTFDAKPLHTVDEKIYGMTYHTNYQAASLADVNVKPDNSSPTYGSSTHTSGSNCVQVWDEGAAETFARLGDQRLSRTLGYRNPSNNSVEPDALPRAKAEALDKIKSNLEYVIREGTFTLPHAGTGAGTTGVWMQRGVRYADGLTVGTADGAVPGVGGGTAGTFGTLSYTVTMDTLQTMWDKKLWQNGQSLVAVCNSTVKRALTTIFKDEFNFGENGQMVNVSGVNLMRFITDFGPVDIVLTHNFPGNDLYFFNMNYMEPIVRPVPGKPNGGLLWERPIAQVTAADAVSFYGELGLNYQTGSAHGRIIGIGSTVIGGQSVS